MPGRVRHLDDVAGNPFLWVVRCSIRRRGVHLLVPSLGVGKCRNPSRCAAPALPLFYQHNSLSLLRRLGGWSSCIQRRWRRQLRVGIKSLPNPEVAIASSRSNGVKIDLSKLLGVERQVDCVVMS
jgi:hypothetical protein